MGLFDLVCAAARDLHNGTPLFSRSDADKAAYQRRYGEYDNPPSEATESYSSGSSDDTTMSQTGGNKSYETLGK